MVERVPKKCRENSSLAGNGAQARDETAMPRRSYGEAQTLPVAPTLLEASARISERLVMPERPSSVWSVEPRDGVD